MSPPNFSFRDFSDLEKSFPAVRRDYRFGHLLESRAASDPLTQLGRWFQEAVRYRVPIPHAFTLATADRRARPSARIMLLKGFDKRGFLFYSSNESRKGRELMVNKAAAMVIHWPPLERQVRISGMIREIPRDESAAYFRARPRSSQIAALASHQSRPISSRKELEKRIRLLTEKYHGKEIPLPAHWCGYRLLPDSLEFWQGRASRLNDRLLFSRQGRGWKVTRLQP